jgi:hypothetical protein
VAILCEKRDDMYMNDDQVISPTRSSGPRAAPRGDPAQPGSE